MSRPRDPGLSLPACDQLARVAELRELADLASLAQVRRRIAELEAARGAERAALATEAAAVAVAEDAAPAAHRVYLTYAAAAARRLEALDKSAVALTETERAAVADAARALGRRLAVAEMRRDALSARRARIAKREEQSAPPVKRH